MSKRSSDHVIPQLRPLQWLPIPLRVENQNMHSGLLGTWGLPHPSLNSSSTLSPRPPHSAHHRTFQPFLNCLPQNCCLGFSALVLSPGMLCSRVVSPACPWSTCSFVTESLPGAPPPSNTAPPAFHHCLLPSLPASFLP